jgi:hypothetical protein
MKNIRRVIKHTGGFFKLPDLKETNKVCPISVVYRMSLDLGEKNRGIP